MIFSLCKSTMRARAMKFLLKSFSRLPIDSKSIAMADGNYYL